MAPRITSAPVTVESGPVQPSLALLAADCHRLSKLAEGLAVPSRRGLLQLIEAIEARLDAIASRAEAGRADGTSRNRAQSLRQETESIEAELAIVQATLEGRVRSLQERPPRTKATKETREMARKPWLFDPEKITELNLLATDDSPEPEGDQDWDEWDAWSDKDDDDDSPTEELMEPRGDHDPVGGWKEHSPRSRGHKRHRSHRQL